MSVLTPKHKSFGGVHPRYHKDASSGEAIRVMPMPETLLVSMSQHMGAPAKPLVKKGDTVLRGQLIGEAAGFISAKVHAPTSGTVKAVSDATTAAGTLAPCIEIEPDGNDEWVPDISGHPNWESYENSRLKDIVADAGVVGMGGAGFPTHVKLSPPPEKPIDTVIINGAECEPYLTADHRLMVEQADAICLGARIIRHILGASVLRIAIEDNKPDAIAAMEKAVADVDGDVAVVALPTEYPQGAEKQQIYAITGREVPSGGLPMDVGCVVENVGTTYAIWDAVTNGRPVTERVTTVTGTPVRTPGNVQARVGTPYAALVEFCGGMACDAAKVVSGGPMMGLAQASLDTPTTKTTSGLLLLERADVVEYTSLPCIACGRCVDACCMNLLPCELSQMLEAEDYDAAEELSVMDCIECGCCAFVCPSHRPLTQHMRQGKAKVMLKRRQAKK